MNNVINEQWKDKGVCDVCRRREYCKTTCTAHKLFRRKALNAMVERAAAQRMAGKEVTKEELIDVVNDLLAE